MFKEMIVEELKKLVPDVTLEIPPDPKLGDFSFPCFSLAKDLKKAPAQIADDLASKFPQLPFVEKVTTAGPYLNFYLKTSDLAKSVMADVFKARDKFGSSNVGEGSTYVIEFSSPNVGKPFHVGHLRSTIIGQSLYKIHDFLGFDVVRLNHIGDWGTQYGKLIAAFLKWGDESRLKEEKVKYMFELYVRYSKESKENEALQDEARMWFKKLEDGDDTAVKLWKEFRAYSLEEFNRVYSLLRVQFDSMNGEAFFNDKMAPVVDIAKEKGLAIEDAGALVVPVPDEIPLMLLKSDGATTYALRDLAAIKYRMETYEADGLLYVVGHEQTLHFKQVFYVAKQLFDPDLVLQHIPFGMYLDKDGKRMASREGKVVFLADVLQSTIDKAKKLIEQKNPDLKNKDAVARMVGVGAVFFGDLMNDRVKDVVFDWDRILDFEGDTGPYLQYTYARARSILRKSSYKTSEDIDFARLTVDCEARLVRILLLFPDTVKDALANYKPHIIAQYALELGRCFNEFYHKCPCIAESDDAVKLARLALVDASSQVLKNALSLLSIEAPDEM